MANFSPRSSLSAAQYQRAMQLYNDAGRVAFYAYIYDLTGNVAFLEMAMISSGSGVLEGGPAWIFNGILQSVAKNYPQGDDAIELFSQKIAQAIAQSIVPDGEFNY